MRRTNRVLTLAALLALVSGGCVSGTVTEQTLPAGTAPEPDVVLAQGALIQFGECETFLDYVISNAIDLVGPYGLDGGPIGWEGGGFTDAMAAEEASRASVGGDDGGSGFSETNVQVEGVDEPDMVKTDGERIVVIAEGELIVVDVTGDEPVETGRTSFHQFAVQSLFLEGDKALLFGSAWSQGPLPLAEFDRGFVPGGTPTLQVIEVDIGDKPEIAHTMTIDGSFISGRMIDGRVRLVITSNPVGFEWEFPSGSGIRAEREATEKNREIVRNSAPENWIPYYVVSDGDGNVVDEGTLFDCDRVAHPREFSGLNMLSVVTIDLASGLDVTDATGVLANGDTVYASGQSLYVATQNWDTWRWQAFGAESDRPDGPTTEIHKFDISSPTRSEYLASGQVDGYLLNQFAMDEHDGMLRVASTTTPAWWGSGPDSESRITVLRQIDDTLVNIGLVEGLGRTEQIYSVRFMGPTAYVVTFRQTDPLYTVDLTDPRQPKLIGELKIPGYSAYLHPVGDGLILGIGQDATDRGEVRGTQVSIFDVSDLSDPQRLDTYTLSEGTNSEVEYDHHAFLYWEGLAMIPVQQWWWDEKGEDLFFGAVGLVVGDDGQLAEIGKVVHPGGDQNDWDGRSQIRRSVVVDGSVYTISHKGIMKSALDTLDEQAWFEF